MKRYQIWDKQSPVITPSGAVFTAEEWKNKYPAAKLDSIVVVCSAGEINGGFYGTLGQMKQNYENQGVDFSNAHTNEEILQTIEDWENQKSEEAKAAAQEAANTPTTEERIAAALEYQNLLAM